MVHGFSKLSLLDPLVGIGSPLFSFSRSKKEPSAWEFQFKALMQDDSTPVSPGYEKLLDVVTWAVAKLSIDRPAEKQEVVNI